MPAINVSKATSEQDHEQSRASRVFDLAEMPLRELNQALHDLAPGSNETGWEVLHPKGSHSVAVGVDQPITIDAGPGVGENMMSGSITVKGDASQYAGATGRGGLLVIEGNASSRCGISMKGIDIVVHGNIGHMSAFMAQSG
ncbi:MAG: protein GlxC, partial [Mesorhizobium sp.]